MTGEKRSQVIHKIGILILPVLLFFCYTEICTLWAVVQDSA